MNNLMALTRKGDKKLVIANISNALLIEESSFGGSVIRYNAAEGTKSYIYVAETIAEMEERLPEGWAVLTRSRDGEQVLVNMNTCLSVEPCYSCTMVRFDMDHESRNYITVSESVEEIAKRMMEE